MIQPPSQRDPIVDESGRVTNVYQRWFADLAKAIGSGASPAPPAPEPPATADHGTIQGLGSIQTFGVLPNIVQLSLEGDDVAPGQTFYYGTGQSADPEESHVARGWHPVSGAMTQGPGLSLTIGANGVTTFALDELPDAGGGTLQKTERDQYGRLAGTSEATTSDLAEGSNLYHTAERVDALITAKKAQPGGLATLDANAKLDAGQLPALAITETFVVSTEAAMLALDVQQGDVAVRSDLQASFILTAEPASTLSNWQELLVPTGVGVASFNGRTGTVTPQTGDYTPAQVGAATAAQGAKADSAVQGSDARLSDSREWTAATVTQAEAEAGTATARRAWTAQRAHQAVRAAVLTGLSTATNAAITAADSVLSAFGKLQAQVTALGSTVSGLITQSITPGDTMHAPSGGAVFDALAGKYDKTGGAISGQFEINGNLHSPGILPGLFGAYVSAPNSTPAFGMFDAYGSSTGLVFRAAIGSASSPIALRNNDLIGQFQARGHDGISYASRESAAIYFEADGDWSAGSHPARIRMVTTPNGGVVEVPRLAIYGGGVVAPGMDNAQDFGAPALRWGQIYAANGSINTSDAREKTGPRDLTESELAAAADIARLPCIFRWLHAIEEKGEDARLHCGPTVQAVIATMQSHGLAPFRYGFVCHDEWEETAEQRDPGTDEVMQEYRPAGDRYSLRPSELAHFIMRGVVARQDDLERRLAALEPE